VPPGVRDYVSPKAAGFDPEAARQLLAEAGYPGGRGLPVIEIMFNKEAAHQVIAESVKDMWRRHLGATVELSSIERGTLRQKVQNLDYSVSRAGWYGDYNDPLTFLDMFLTAPEGGGGNNDTGFANAEYDRLIAEATREGDPARRNELLHRAEQILIVEEMPIIPLYYYADMYLFRPEVRNFWPNRMGINPLRFVEVREDAGGSDSLSGGAKASGRSAAAEEAGMSGGEVSR
jgi:oligopeptide transport system substrate-binding protein